jgi:hypothetical protein
MVAGELVNSRPYGASMLTKVLVTIRVHTAAPWRLPAQCRAVTADLPEKRAMTPEKLGAKLTFGLDARR